ncbi:MAG: hypothetical protein LH628_17725 [Microcoleus sp. CAN_BIN18]|nr:hypothetical protein [Microcoleus sp. CAN_BIN18]
MRNFSISGVCAIDRSYVEGLRLARTPTALNLPPSSFHHWQTNELPPELSAHNTTTATLLSIGTNVKIVSIY